MKLYLAGPINACSDDEVTGWREQVKTQLHSDLASWLSVEIVDPADRDFRGVENETHKTIVEGDKADIYGCDAVLAYCWQPSYGTAMEILYAWECGIPVYAVVPADKPISPWVQYHSARVGRNLYASVVLLMGDFR